MKKKVIALVLVCVLVFGIAVGGTLAWLQAKTGTVTNTFTTSDVSIELTENGEKIESDVTKSFKMVPGTTIGKNVDVTVLKGSEACYLFVKIVEENNFNNYFDAYAVNNAWTKLDGVSGVYYCEVNASNANVTKDVIESVTVKTSVNKVMMEAAKTSAPTLSFTAYAVQKDNVVADGEKSAVEVAWDIAQGLDA